MDAAYRDEFEQFKQTNAKWQETFLSRIEQCLIQKGTLRTLQDAVGITGMPFFKLSEKEPENLENHAVVERSAETRARRNCAFRNLRNGYSDDDEAGRGNHPLPSLQHGQRWPCRQPFRYRGQSLSGVLLLGSRRASKDLVTPFPFVCVHRNSRRKPPNSFGWRNAANLSLPIYLVVPDERRVSFHPLC